MRLALIALIALTGCPGRGGAYPQPLALNTAKGVISHLAQTRAARTSFTGESVMDYWVGSNRLKGTVLVMGTSQRQVRFNALSPQGGGVLVDMACNGTDFAMVDFQNNCAVTGPCTGASIASLLHVQLEPEDFLALALGTPPVLDQAAGTVTWDASKGREKVKLAGPAGTETIEIDGRDGRTDVLSSELVGIDGKIVWSVDNADFGNVKEASGGQQRLPNKTRFKSPGQQADLLVEWKERTLNVAIEASKFVITVPPGLPTCPH
jgi:hypothetical protein